MIHISLQGSQQNLPHGASHSMTVRAALSGKWELTTYNAFSRLTRDLSTTFQSSTGAHTKRTWLPATTCYVVATGFLHSLEPQAPLFAGYPADYASCLAIHTVC